MELARWMPRRVRAGRNNWRSTGSREILGTRAVSLPSRTSCISGSFLLFSSAGRAGVTFGEAARPL